MLHAVKNCFIRQQMFVIDFGFPYPDTIIVGVGENGDDFGASVQCVFFLHIRSELVGVIIGEVLLSFDAHRIISRVITVRESAVQFVVGGLLPQ